MLAIHFLPRAEPGFTNAIHLGKDVAQMTGINGGCQAHIAVLTLAWNEIPPLLGAASGALFEIAQTEEGPSLRVNVASPEYRKALQFHRKTQALDVVRGPLDLLATDTLQL